MGSEFAYAQEHSLRSGASLECRRPDAVRWREPTMQAPSETSGPTGEPTFGARFLEEYKRRGGALSSFSYAELQEIKGCDREGLIRALRAAQPMTSFRALQRIRQAESPEELAREVGHQLELQAAQSATSLWMIIALLT
jgi:hypothetical protein